MKQAAKLASAIAHGPKLLFLDEPTNGLDPPARTRMIQLIQEIRDRGDLQPDPLLALAARRGGVLRPGADSQGRQHRRVSATSKRSAAPTCRFLEIETRGANNGSFLAAIERLGCETATGAQGRIKLILPDGIEVRQLYEVAAAQNVQIRRLNHKRDSLEDIFLKAMEAPIHGMAAHGRYKKTYRPYEGALTAVVAAPVRDHALRPRRSAPLQVPEHRFTALSFA